MILDQKITKLKSKTQWWQSNSQRSLLLRNPQLLRACGSTTMARSMSHSILQRARYHNSVPVQQLIQSNIRCTGKISATMLITNHHISTATKIGKSNVCEEQKPLSFLSSPVATITVALPTPLVVMVPSSVPPPFPVAVSAPAPAPLSSMFPVADFLVIVIIPTTIPAPLPAFPFTGTYNSELTPGPVQHWQSNRFITVTIPFSFPICNRYSKIQITYRTIPWQSPKSTNWTINNPTTAWNMGSSKSACREEYHDAQLPIQHVQTQDNSGHFQYAVLWHEISFWGCQTHHISLHHPMIQAIFRHGKQWLQYIYIHK